MFSTFGIPTRTCERSLGGDATKRFFADQIGNVGKRIFGFLYPNLDDFHFVQIFHQSLGAGVVHDHPLPTLLQWDFAPLPAFSTLQFHVDEAALARYGTPMTHRVDRSRRLIDQSLDR